jgi:ribonuclease P protein component
VGAVEAYYRENDAFPRLAVSASSRCLKQAVARNAFKRQVRELFRAHREELTGLDVLVRARIPIARHPRHHRDEIEQLFQTLCRERSLS